MIKALIFDFDGLILDTESPIFVTWNELYKSFGCELPLESWVTLIGGSDESFDPFKELERQLGRSLDEAVIEPPRRKKELELIDTQAILPGVMEYLNDAKELKLKIGLASSSTREWVSSHLSRLGIFQYFDSICTRDDVKQVKPSPELYQSVLDILKICPAEGLVLEDSPNGIQAAKALGLFCVAIPNPMTRDLCFDQADLILNSLVEKPLRDVITLAERNHR
ncbi:MAG: HAD family hydrolase [Anaerolineales bacterium]|nr:HAD family hydrolase [Anaerolineales bacterium]